MKALNAFLLAAALVASGSSAALADSDSPTLREQAEQTFFLTGDATAAKAAGYTDAQISKMKAQPAERIQFND